MSQQQFPSAVEQSQQPPGQSQQSDGRTRQSGGQTQQSGGQTQQTGAQTQMGGQAQQRGLQGREYPTRTYLSDDARRESIRLLNGCLADTTVLVSQVRYAHWNVKGRNFYQFHELFEEIAEGLEDHIDDIAERATSLGGEALGTTYMAASNSEIQPLPGTATDGLEFATLLADRLAVHDANLSRDIEAADRVGDVDTADLLNEVSRDVGKFIWFLEAHTQGQSQGQSIQGQSAQTR